MAGPAPHYPKVCVAAFHEASGSKHGAPFELAAIEREVATLQSKKTLIVASQVTSSRSDDAHAPGAWSRGRHPRGCQYRVRAQLGCVRQGVVDSQQASC